MAHRGAFSLTYVLIAFFLVEGVASIMFAIEHKRDLRGAWGWMLVSGLVDIILGESSLQASLEPLSGLWVSLWGST